MKSSHARLALAALSALAALLVLAPTAGAATIQVPGGNPSLKFGPPGPGVCALGLDATGSGDLAAGVGSGDFSAAKGNGKITSGSPTVTEVDTAIGAFAAGQDISGTGIPPATTILAVDSGAGTLTMSANATSGAATNTNLTAGSKTVTNVTTSQGALAVGQVVSAVGVPAATTITALGAGTFTLSANPTTNSSAFGTGIGNAFSAGSLDLTNVSAGCGAFAVGQGISATGIQIGTTITATGAGTLTLSKPPTAPGTGVALSAGATFGAGSDPTSLAFNQAAHRLYALASAGAADKVHAFDSPALTLAGGAFPFSVADGNNAADIAVDNTAGPAPSAGNIYHVLSAFGGADRLYGYNSAGAPLGGAFPVNPLGPSFCGIAVDPSGFIYAGDGNNVRKYSPAGALLATFSIKVCKLSFDSSGDMFAVVGGAVTKYTAASGFASGTPIDPNIALAVAVNNSTNQLYVVHSNKVSVWGTDGTQLNADFATGIAGESLRGIAVDQSNKVAYVSDPGNGKIYVFGFQGLTVPTVITGTADPSATTATLHGAVNPSGLPVSDCHFEYTSEAEYGTYGFKNSTHVDCGANPGSGSSSVPVAAGVNGLNPGTDYRFRLVVSNANATGLTGGIKTLTTAGPQVKDEAPTQVASTSTTLSAQINPNGEGTSYRFQYVGKADFDQSGFANASQVPAAVVGIGSGKTYLEASQPLSGLTPGATYHFRAVASNSSATTTGKGSAFTTLAQDNSDCSNAAVRAQQGSDYLPDCRAYGQVSPVEKNGFGVSTGGPIVARPDGKAIAYTSLGAFAGTAGSPFPNSYAATFESGSWLTDPLDPPIEAAVDIGVGAVIGTSGDLTKQLVGTNAKLTPEAVEGDPTAANFYVHDRLDGSYQYVGTSHVEGTTPAGNNLFSIEFSGASYDGRIFVFGSAYTFDSTPPPPPAADRSLYEFDAETGALSYVGVLPGGGIYSKSTSGAGSQGAQGLMSAVPFHPVSADGERVYWQARGGGQDSGGILYLRENGQSTLVSKRQSDGSAQPAPYFNASEDGLLAYFSSPGKLTADASPAGDDLYRYDAEADQLSDLTSDLADAAGANVQNILGVSDDGAYVYFTATGALAPGAVPGKPSLYAWHGGATRLIGTLGLDVPIRYGGATIANENSYRISPGGRYLTFLTRGQISGPHPFAASTFRQAYLYDYEADSLACPSCPTGPGVADTGLSGDYVKKNFAYGSNYSSFLAYLAERSRNVTDSGRLFFQSKDALLPEDVNGVQDVYEYEAGHLSLISSGQSNSDSWFGDATPDGGSAFFVTREGLVGSDLDPSDDLYVAKVGGGLLEPPAPVPCDLNGGACEGAATTPPDTTGAGSGVFQGPEDKTATPPPRCPKGKHKVRRGGKTRCVNKPKPHKHHKRANHKRRAKR